MRLIPAPCRPKSHGENFWIPPRQDQKTEIDSRSDPNSHVKNLYEKNSPITKAASSAEQRASLSLCMEKIALHDELILKSVIRLLNYRTQHNWIIETDRADLHIIGEEAPKTTDCQTPSNILWVGRSAQSRTPFLYLPIRANELELLLNSLGASILKKQADAHSGQPAPLRPDEMLALHRWPPASILNTPLRIKLATLLTAQSMSLDTLALRSGVTPHDCELFCQALEHAGILQRGAADAEAAPPHELSASPATQARPDASLLRRIRRRFGI
jgi:hypothetical protein